MRSTQALVPALALASIVSLSACTQVSSSGGKGSQTNQPSVSSSSAPTSSDTTPSDAPTSSSSETSSSSSSSESSSSSSSPESSSSGASGASITADDIRQYAKTHETRTCKLLDIDYITGGAQFCRTDNSSISAGYKGQLIYFTTAVQYESGATYSYTVSNGSDSQSKNFDAASTHSQNGDPITLQVYVPMDSGGNYTVKFKKNGSEFANDSAQVTVN